MHIPTVVGRLFLSMCPSTNLYTLLPMLIYCEIPLLKDERNTNLVLSKFYHDRYTNPKNRRHKSGKIVKRFGVRYVRLDSTITASPAYRLMLMIHKIFPAHQFTIAIC